ncbi:hypothetical protein PSACC_02088 [Paramicrosporidium saccamoebae]|uniref:Uncharacterized protein n=1 Tax=Paramicrosporidium saccamoebae TaxID=1246581 RepID=A0A2H9TK31_9FUNG|nr:hypothetical protein PSACC_02088 [Paramicrosporidium saccamoebae]
MESVCQNLHNPHINRIHFIESEARHVYNQLGPHCNVTLAQLGRKARFYSSRGLRSNVEWSDRLTAGSAFRFASRYLPGKTVILANLDIYFDATLRLLKSDQWLSVSAMYFLSRYESDERISIGTQCGPAYMGSHDSFVFVPPLPRALVERTNQLALGMPGMENRMIHDFRRAGIRILNPCKSIRSWHSHRSGVRHLVLPLANTNNQSGIVRPSKLIRNPTADDY